MRQLGKSILLVEDDQDFAALVVRALEKSDFPGAVVIARSAGEAMGHLLPARSQPAGVASRPCVVFLDLSLPNVDGLGLLQCIRADYAIRSVPVVIFSSSMQREDIERAYAEGANSYVQKPTSADALFETVRLLATYWLRLNEPAPHI